jgi:hypothetical protein
MSKKSKEECDESSNGSAAKCTKFLRDKRI